MRLRLRKALGEPILGHNMHCLRGHPRLTFLQKNYRPGTALDVGSGQGAFALWLHRQGCHVTMLDILPVEPPAPGIEVLQMDLHDLERHTGRYDTVVFMEIIEHVPDPELAVALCYHVTAPGGVLLITTPWVTKFDYLRDHLWRFDQAGVEELLAPYGARAWSGNECVYAVVEKPREPTD